MKAKVSKELAEILKDREASRQLRNLLGKRTARVDEVLSLTIGKKTYAVRPDIRSGQIRLK